MVTSHQPPTENLWEHTAGEPVSAPSLTDTVDTDVVIIGGGYTGCSAALHLVEAGTSVCLLEAETIGFGGSGRNVGLVNAGLWVEPEKVEVVLGVSAGRKLNEALAEGPALVFSLIDKYAIDCEATHTGTLHCAHSKSGLTDLKERLRQYRVRGAPVDLLDSKDTELMTGSRQYHGALLDHRAGTIQPLAYVRGLAKAAREAGAMVYEHSPAAALSFGDRVWRVDTSGGSVRAGALFVATNAYHHGLITELAPRYVAVNYFQFATPPLKPELRSSILPQRQGAWDTATVMSSFRVDFQGRLLIGAIGSLDHAGGAVHRSWAIRKLQKLFPQAADYGYEYGWCGRIAMTVDHLPRAVRLGAGGLSMYGYSGRGIAPGTMFGKSAARYFLTGDESELALNTDHVQFEKLRAIKTGYYEFGASAFHFLDCR